MAGDMGYMCVYEWGKANQIFIEFHLDGHKASLRSYWAATRENGTNTNTSSNPSRPVPSRSFVIKFDCEYCTALIQGADCYSGHLFDCKKKRENSGVQSKIHTRLETRFQLMHYSETQSLIQADTQTLLLCWKTRK